MKAALSQVMFTLRQNQAGAKWQRCAGVLFFTILVAGCSILKPIKPESRNRLAPFLPTQVRGLAYYTLGQEPQQHVITKGIRIPPGATIRIGTDSSLDLFVCDGIRVRILPNSNAEVDLKEVADSITVPSVTLEGGGLLCLVTSANCETNFHLNARSLMVILLQPGEYQVQASGETAVFKGRVALWEAMDGPSLLFVEVGHAGKPDENRARLLSPDAYASVIKAFDELKKE